MSLTALLSLSSSSKGSSAASIASAPSAKLLDVYQRVPLQAKLRRNEHGVLKPQQLHFKLYGTNTKSRYRSLLAGFSVDVVEHFDRLLALNEAPLPLPSARAIDLNVFNPIATSAISLDHNNDNITSNTSSTKNYSNQTSASLPVLLGATSGLYAPQSSLSLFMDSLHFLPAATASSSWRKTPLTTTTSNNSTGSAENKPQNPVDRQIELVAMPPSHRQDPESPRSRSKSRSKAITTVRVHSRSRRTSITSSSSSTSRSPTSRGKQSELRRATRANAQLSSALMHKKLLEATSSVAALSTASYASQSHVATAINDIGYEIDEEELANRFYTELKSNDSRETTSNASGAATPPLSPAQHQQIRFMTMDDDEKDAQDEDSTRETEWKARQLALEQQVAVLLVENQAKTALIKYLMDENSRIVGDCECGKAVTSPAPARHELSSPAATRDETTQHSSTCASNGRAQGSHESSPVDSATMISELSSKEATATQVSPSQVPEAKWKLPETGTHSTIKQSKQQVMAARETLLFEGLVSEIEAEFSQLFTCERSTESGEMGSTAA